jgi:hypothetical protein
MVWKTRFKHRNREGETSRQISEHREASLIERDESLLE